LGRGDIKVDLPLGNKYTTITLKNTLYTPKMALTLSNYSCRIFCPIQKQCLQNPILHSETEDHRFDCPSQWPVCHPHSDRGKCSCG
jgi:hypothetical protein